MHRLYSFTPSSRIFVEQLVCAKQHSKLQEERTPQSTKKEESVPSKSLLSGEGDRV